MKTVEFMKTMTLARVFLVSIAVAIAALALKFMLRMSFGQQLIRGNEVNDLLIWFLFAAFMLLLQRSARSRQRVLQEIESEETDRDR